MKRAHWLWCGGGLLALVVVLLCCRCAGNIRATDYRATDCRAAGLPADDADHPRDDPQQLGQSPADRTPANFGKAFA
jgi:hypothetical protein